MTSSCEPIYPPNSHRYFLELAFNGSAYHGWQIQKNALSVQEVLNRSLSILLREEIETTGCGRTDTGVHATQFYAHFDSKAKIEPSSSFIFSLNAILPKDIAAKRMISVKPDAHTRFDATLRSYEYHIHFDKNPFLEGFSWLLRDEPDIILMNQAAGII